jgi:hypothetical protein
VAVSEDGVRPGLNPMGHRCEGCFEQKGKSEEKSTQKRPRMRQSCRDQSRKYKIASAVTCGLMVVIAIRMPARRKRLRWSARTDAASRNSTNNPN